MLSDSFDRKTKQAICTQTGGAISTLLFYPIDTVRFRTMSHDSTDHRLHHDKRRYRGVIEPMRLVVQHEGTGALYRGASVAVGGAAASWGIYVYLYRSLQQLSQEQFGWRGFEADMINSTMASVGTAYLTTPIWHVKTRMQLEDTTPSTKAAADSSTSSSSSGDKKSEGTRRYSKFFPSLASVFKTDGFFGLWRGFAPQLLMSVVNAAYLPVYQRVLTGVNSRWGTPPPEDARKETKNSSSSSLTPGTSSFTPSSWTVAVSSASTRTIISLLSNPLFVLRTKLQDERHSVVSHVSYRNVWQAASVIVREEGFKGFYRGLRATLTITAPKSMVTMVLTEKFYQMAL